jgi:hypothetical protein
MAWYDTLVAKMGPAKPEDMKALPDNLAKLKVDIEAYIKGMTTVAPKCGLKQTLGKDPIAVAVVGNPAKAVFPEGHPKVGKDVPGVVQLEVLNDGAPGKATTKKAFEEWTKTRDKAMTKVAGSSFKVPNGSKLIYRLDQACENFFMGSNAQCMGDEDGEVIFEIWVNAHNKISKEIGGSVIHEIFHCYGAQGHPEGPHMWGGGIDRSNWFDEAWNEYFTRDFVEKNAGYKGSFAPLKSYDGLVPIAEAIIEQAGIGPCAKLYFNRWNAPNAAAKAPVDKVTVPILKHCEPNKADLLKKIPANDLKVFAEAVKANIK